MRRNAEAIKENIDSDLERISDKWSHLLIECFNNFAYKLLSNLKISFFDMYFESQTKIVMIPMLICLCIVMVYTHFVLITVSVDDRVIDIVTNNYVYNIITKQEAYQVELENIKTNNDINISFEPLTILKIYYKELINHNILKPENILGNITNSNSLINNVLFDSIVLTSTLNFSLQSNDIDYLNNYDRAYIDILKINYLLSPLIFQRQILQGMITTNYFTIYQTTKEGEYLNNNYGYYQTPIIDDDINYYPKINFSPYDSFIDISPNILNNQNNWYSFYDQKFISNNMTALNQFMFANNFDISNHQFLRIIPFSIFKTDSVDSKNQIIIGLANSILKTDNDINHSFYTLSSINNNFIDKNLTFNFINSNYAISSSQNILFNIPEFLDLYQKYTMNPVNSSFISNGVGILPLLFNKIDFNYNDYILDQNFQPDLMLFDILSLYNTYYSTNKNNNLTCKNFNFTFYFSQITNNTVYNNCLNQTEVLNYKIYSNSSLTKDRIPNCMCIPFYCLNYPKNKTFQPYNFSDISINNNLILPQKCKIDFTQYDSSLTDFYNNMIFEFRSGNLSIDSNFKTMNVYFSTNTNTDKLHDIFQAAFNDYNYVIYIYIGVLLCAFCYFICFIFKKTNKFNKVINDILQSNFVDMIINKPDKKGEIKPDNFLMRSETKKSVIFELDAIRRRSASTRLKNSIEKKKKFQGINNGNKLKLNTINENADFSDDEVEKINGVDLTISDGQLIDDVSDRELHVKSSEVNLTIEKYDKAPKIKTSKNKNNNNTDNLKVTRFNENKFVRKQTFTKENNFKNTLMQIKKQKSNIKISKAKSIKKKEESELEDIRELLINNQNYFKIDLNQEDNFLQGHYILKNFNIKSRARAILNDLKIANEDFNDLEVDSFSRAILSEILSTEQIKLDLYALNFFSKYKVNYTINEMYAENPSMMDLDLSQRSEFLEDRMHSIANNMKLLETETPIFNIAKCISEEDDITNQMLDDFCKTSAMKSYVNYYLEQIYLNWLRKVHENNFLDEFEV